MVSTRLLLLTPLLLVACGTGSGGLPTPLQDDDVPTVARPTRPAPSICKLAPAWLEQVGGLKNLQGINVLPARLEPQATGTLYDLLLASRLVINGNYWGTSTVDLQALHERYEAAFRKGFGHLRQAAPSAAADQLMNDYIGALGDGHTYYLTAPQYQAHLDRLRRAPTPTPRYGFQWAAVPGEDGAVLLEVQTDTPAAEAGLERGDTILSVNGVALTRRADEAATAEAYTTALSAAVQSGQPVTLLVRRATHTAQTRTVSVTPRLISSSARPYGAFLNPSTFWLRVPTFMTTGDDLGGVTQSVTAGDTHALVAQAQAGGASHIVLDLRRNGGGLLTEAVGVAAAFVPALAGETIELLNGGDVTFAYRSGKVLGGMNCDPQAPLLNIPNPVTWTGRTTVLVNAYSASGSEIVAQLLRQGGASVVGEQTYGVGNTVTNITSLLAGRGLAVTSGLGRDLRGEYLSADVTPSLTVGDDLRALAHGTDQVLQAALEARP